MKEAIKSMKVKRADAVILKLKDSWSKRGNDFNFYFIRHARGGGKIFANVTQSMKKVCKIDTQCQG